MRQMKVDLLRRYHELEDIEDLVGNYRVTRTAYLDQLKKMAVFGVTRGSLKYLETLLECMQLPEGLIPEDYDIQQAEDSHLNQLY